MDYLSDYNDRNRSKDMDYDSDMYALTMMTLLALKSTEPEKYGSMVNLMYLMDQATFKKVLQVFGGTTITIPTLDEWDDIILGVIYYQLSFVERKNNMEVYPHIGMTTRTIDREKLTKIQGIARSINEILNEDDSTMKMPMFDTRKKWLEYGQEG